MMIARTGINQPTERPNHTIKGPSQAYQTAEQNILRTLLDMMNLVITRAPDVFIHFYACTRQVLADIPTYPGIDAHLPRKIKEILTRVGEIEFYTYPGGRTVCFLGNVLDNFPSVSFTEICYHFFGNCPSTCEKGYKPSDPFELCLEHLLPVLGHVVGLLCNWVLYSGQKHKFSLACHMMEWLFESVSQRDSGVGDSVRGAEMLHELVQGHLVKYLQKSGRLLLNCIV